jgi:hypothetical protein
MVQGTRSDSLIDQALAGWAFRCCENTVTPTGANDFMAFQNTSPDYCYLTSLGLTNAGAEIITGSIAANYTIAGTNAVPDTSFNRSGAANALSTKMQVAVGVTVTGTGAVLSVPLTFTTGAGTEYQNILNGRDWIEIPPLHTFTLGAATGTAAITTISAELHFLMEPRVNL